MNNILIVDDDIELCQLLDRFLKRKGYNTQFCTSGKKAQDSIKVNSFDLVLCDFRLPDSDGLIMLEYIKSVSPATKVIMITGYMDIKIAVNAIKSGASDYLTKPLLPEEILLTIEKVLKQKVNDNISASQSGSNHGEIIASATKSHYSEKYIIGKSKLSEELQQQIELVAPTNYSIIIYGESGTGKEHAAYQIHALSKRKEKPFVAVDCGTLTKELAGSELFGHEKGSFTGANNSKVGQFELADGGTIFLDEISNLSYEIQVSLLRVIQERRIRRIGSQKEIPIDVRIIVASNEKLNESASTGKFRMDLFHRFNEFTINLPSLKERKEDMMVFADFFLEKASEELGKRIQGFDPEVESIFQNYSWPGNLREMNNVIKRAALLSGKNVIAPEALPPEMVFHSKFNLTTQGESNYKTFSVGTHSSDLKSVIINAEYHKILEVLQKVNFNKSKAAQLLNIDRKTLYNKMNAYNMMYN